MKVSMPDVSCIFCLTLASCALMSCSGAIRNELRIEVVAVSEEVFANKTITVEGFSLGKPRRTTEGVWLVQTGVCVEDRKRFLETPIEIRVQLDGSTEPVVTTVERFGCREGNAPGGNLEIDRVELKADGAIDARFEQNELTWSICGETNPEDGCEEAPRVWD